MFIDSHCHLNYPDFKEDIEAVLERAKRAQVTHLLTICTKLSEADEVLALAQNHPQICCSIGVHPHEAKEAVDERELSQKIEAYLQQDKVVALGETGLDFYYEHSPKAEQMEAFQTHLELAEKYDLPLVVHTRDAEQETIDMLSAFKGKVRGVIHCFSGTQWLADEALKLGFYISISGIATFKKAESIRETIKSVPIDRLLIETDAPYLAPVPYRGKRNEPAYVVHTAEQVAELKDMPLPEVGRITTDNYFHLFSKHKRG